MIPYSNSNWYIKYEGKCVSIGVHACFPTKYLRIFITDI